MLCIIGIERRLHGGDITGGLGDLGSADVTDVEPDTAGDQHCNDDQYHHHFNERETLIPRGGIF